MSASAAKGARRDLRRAAGAEAVGVIEQHTAAINAIGAVLYGRGFWGRLRWLLTGQ